jgi:hypothetical protein
MKNKYIAIIALLFLFIACKKEENRFSTLEKANWVLQEWENKTPDGDFSEKWRRQNDSTFYAESFFIAKQDTLFAETIQLIQRDTSLVLIIAVPNQNEEKPVTFKLTSLTDKEFIFENPTHDFPKKIRYTLVNQDSLYAEISGDGKKQGYPFKKK